MLAEAELVCPNCGNLRSVCADATRDWYPFRSYCYATAARDQTVRKLQDRLADKQLRQADVDGMSVGVMLDDPDPDETFFD